ncbi:MAG: hypothetical protein ACI9XO_001869 [Paraglaciecola sp.]|jgi:hypothetical protein
MIKSAFFQTKINFKKMELLYTFSVIFFIFGLSFILINIRQILTGNEFRGTCATNNPMLKKEIGDCTVCGKKAGDDCAMPEVKA